MRFLGQPMRCISRAQDYLHGMITDYPAPLFPLDSGRAGRGLPPPRRGGLAKSTGAWKYHADSRRGTRLASAIIVSLLIHGSAFKFIGPVPERVIKPRTSDTPAIVITMPNLKDLEEPEPVVTDAEQPIDVAALVPMQADLPQVARPTDFVQRIDFNSLVDRPDMAAAKVFAVPENINRGAAIRQSVGAVFNLADLDRIPEPLVRPPPVFPPQLKREVQTATVRVQFIVDSTGQVIQAVAVHSTHSGFNGAAVSGVSKWRFRPGIKNGRRVNTRMEVPIIFNITDD